MSVLTFHTIGTDPTPTVFVVFHSIQEELANLIGLILILIFLFLLLDDCFKLGLVPVGHIFIFFLSINLFSLVSVKINFVVLFFFFLCLFSSFLFPFVVFSVFSSFSFSLFSSSRFFSPPLLSSPCSPLLSLLFSSLSLPQACQALSVTNYWSVWATVTFARSTSTGRAPNSVGNGGFTLFVFPFPIFAPLCGFPVKSNTRKKLACCICFAEFFGDVLIFSSLL